MREIDSPDHLQMFVSFLLDNVAHQALQLVILIIPSAEDIKAAGHDLFELIKGQNHEPSSPQDFEHLRHYITTDGLDKPQGPLDGILGVADFAQMRKNPLNTYPIKVKKSSNYNIHKLKSAKPSQFDELFSS